MIPFPVLKLHVERLPGLVAELLDHRVADARLRRRGDRMRMSTKANALAWLGRCVALAATLGAHTALAADAVEGKRLAQTRCASCHIVMPNQRAELANSPPFDAIARMAGFNRDILAYLILDPHPRMNMTLTRREAEDIAAYITTLGK